MRLEERFIKALKEPICDNCLGRTVGHILSGKTNEQRGRTVKEYVAMMIDSGEKLDLYMPNFHGIKFRNLKEKIDEPGKCEICKNFFRDGIDAAAENAVKKLKGLEFSTFVVGSMPTDEMQNSEEKLWNEIGIDYVEPMKSEINREVGKKVEKLTGKRADIADPDIVIILDMKKNETRLQVKSLFISGGYRKLVRGIPQTRWMCQNCGGKGCVECRGEGKLYKTSVHEIIGAPAMKMADGKDHAFHGSGREDIDARCLDYRPFVIEVTRPKKRKIDLKKLEKMINKSSKVKVGVLKFSDKEYVRKIKADRHDKTYSAEVDFEKILDKKLLPKIKSLKGARIDQQTPTRVRHRRADLLRRRGVKEISYSVLGTRKLRIKVRGEAGLYIKELISGDDGRTKPNVAALLNNKVKKILLDVIKVHPVK